MRRVTPRFRSALALLLLAWFAQVCLPVAHAAMTAGPRAEMPWWCGDMSRASAVAATLPAEIREALGLGEPGAAEHLAECERLCANGSPPAAGSVSSVAALRAAGLEPASAIPPVPRAREQASTPPSQGPPALD